MNIKKGSEGLETKLCPPFPGMPQECMPHDEQKRGRLSYTISNDASGAKVEVLLKGRAFRIVRMAPFDKDGYLERNMQGYP